MGPVGALQLDLCWCGWMDELEVLAGHYVILDSFLHAGKWVNVQITSAYDQEGVPARLLLHWVSIYQKGIYPREKEAVM